MNFEMTEEEKTVRVFNFNNKTFEFISAEIVIIPPHTGLPGSCTLTPPMDEIPAGMAAVFDVNAQLWELVEDHRGETVYSQATGDSTLITDLGPLPEGVVTVSPAGNYQKWDGSAWVLDEDAEKRAMMLEAKAKKASLMQLATDTIAPLQDAHDLDMATDEETQNLNDWKVFRILLNRVNINSATDIKWPEIPA